MSVRLISRERIVAGWGEAIIAPENPASGNPAIIVCGPGSHNGMGTLQNHPYLNELADAGYTIIAHDLGTILLGTSSWANDTAMTQLNAVVAAAESWGHEYLFLHGISMGGFAALRRLKESLEHKITATALVKPLVDVQRYIDEQGQFAAVNTAWGSQWNARRPFVDPILHAERYQNENLMIQYGVDDVTTPPAAVLEFCDRARINPIPLAGTHTTVAPRADQIIDYFDSFR